MRLRLRCYWKPGRAHRNCSFFATNWHARCLTKLFPLIRLAASSCCSIAFASIINDIRRTSCTRWKGFRFYNEFPDTNFVELYQVWSDYNRTLAAVLSAKPVDVSYLHQPAPLAFIDGLLLYFVRMLDYPDVDVRLLAANACLDLLVDETTNPLFLLQM